MICDPCKRQDHVSCPNGHGINRNGDAVVMQGTHCFCQHRIPDPGQQITDEINADSAEVQRLRESREQARNGERSRRVPL